MSEVTDVLDDWFSSSGFDVRRHSIKSGNTILYAQRQSENWQVNLQRYTPLATRVRARCQFDGKPDSLRLNRLWQFMDATFRQPEAVTGKAGPAVPAAVRDQIGAVVCINTRNGTGGSQFSGVLIGPEGLVLCTAHGFETADVVTVRFGDGRQQVGRVLKIDLQKDLALFTVDSHQNPYVLLENGRDFLDPGERLFAVGCPENSGGTVFSGRISGPPRRVASLPLWQVNMKIYPGSSGSPVFDVRGNLAGIVKGRYRGAARVGFLVPLETIFAFLNGM